MQKTQGAKSVGWKVREEQTDGQTDRQADRGIDQVKICDVDRHGECGAWAYNRGLEAEPSGPTTHYLSPPCKNSSDLYQFRERPLAKVGWTCPPQSTRISLSSLLVWSVIIISRTEWFGNCKWVVDTDWLAVVPGCRDLTRVPRVHCQAARGALRQRRWAGSSPTVPRAAWTAVHPSTCQTENALNRRHLKQHQNFKYASK